MSLFRNFQLKFAVDFRLNGKQTRNNNNQNEIGNSTPECGDKIKKHNTSGDKRARGKLYKQRFQK